ncbi:MAG: DUF4785 family protein [Proteobacteria bacterium]|nr:MAG: DUF4785 family protein [Pseudomonadota bacterium]
MKTIKKLSLLSLMSLSGLGLAQYTPQWTEAPQQIDLVDMTSFKSISQPVNSEQQAVRFHYSLLGSDQLSDNNQGYLAESKQYWLNTNAQKLSQGLQLPVTSDLAVIRINPLNPTKSSQSLNQQDITVQQFDQTLSVDVFADSEQLKATGMPVSDYTVAFNVHTQPGMLTLSMPTATKALAKGDTFIIHVFEPNSEYVLQLKTSQQQYAANQVVKINSQLLSQSGVNHMTIAGYITQPNGEKLTDLSFQQNKNGDYQATIGQLTGQSLAHGLWEVHTIASSDINGLKVMRDVSTAFALSLPTARINQQLAVQSHGLKLGLDVAAAGRYEVSAVLSGINAQGEKQPIAMLMSAAQLNKGQADLTLDLPQDLIRQSGFKGPFVVDHISLKNQSLMVPVQQLSAGIQLMPLGKPMDQDDLR